MVAAASLLIVVGLVVASNMAASATSGSARDERRAVSNDVTGRHGLERMRRASSFVRIGKAAPQSPLGGADDAAAADNDIAADRRKTLRELQKLLAVELDADPAGAAADGAQFDSFDESKRASSFVRIGKSQASLTEDSNEELAIPDKKASAFVRIGRQHPASSGHGASSLPNMDDFYRKRMSSFVRIGKKSVSMDEDQAAAALTSHSLPCGSAADGPCFETESTVDGSPAAAASGSQVVKKASSFVRIGRSA